MTQEELLALGLTEEQAGQVLTLHQGEEQTAGERLEAMRQSWQEDTARLQLENAVERSLWQSGARSIRAVRGMLDTGVLALDADGSVTGLEEQLAALRQSDGYLFAPSGAARLSSGGTHGSGAPLDYSRMSDEEYYSAKLGAKK